MVVGFFPTQKNNCLAMLRKREHIHRNGLYSLVAAPDQVRGVPRQGVRPAGNVDDALRGQFQGRGEEFLVAARAGRVHHQHIQREPLLGHFDHEAARIVTEETGVAHAVEAGVFFGIAHSVGVQLHADDLLCMPRRAQANGTRTAVGVQQGFLAGEACQVDGRAVEHLRLAQVDLIKALRADAEAQATQLILQIARAKEGYVELAQHHAGFAGVDVQHHGGDLRMAAGQFRHEGLAAGEFLARGHQHHHDLPRHIGGTDQHMAQKTAMGVFIIYPQLEAGDHLHNGADDGVGARIMQQALLHRNHMVRPRRIHAGDNLAFAILRQHHMHLAAIVGGVVHAQNGLHRADAVQQLFDGLLLALKLLGVGQMHQLAAAAAGGNRAGRVIRLWGCYFRIQRAFPRRKLAGRAVCHGGDSLH